jgi:hypothetical protein
MTIFHNNHFVFRSKLLGPNTISNITIYYSFSTEIFIEVLSVMYCFTMDEFIKQRNLHIWVVGRT